MKHLRLPFLFLVLIAGNPVVQGQTPQTLIDQFFTLYESGKPAEAIDFLYSTNSPEMLQQIRGDIEKIKIQFSDLNGIVGDYYGKERLVEEKLVDPEDINLIQVIDEPERVVEAIFKHYESRPFGPLPNERELMLNL